MDNRQQFANYDYSTLEVAHQNQNTSPLHEGQEKYLSHDQNGAPEVVNSSHLPEVAPKREYIANAAPYGDTNTLSPSPPYPNSQYTQSPGPPHSVATYDPETPPVQERRIWGIKRRTFFILLGVLLVVIIGAVVGGAVGATSGKTKNGEVKSDPTPDPKPTGNGTTDGTPDIQSAILQNSRIAAVNWTDDNAVAYHGVFWQAKDDSLMVSVRDSKTNSWTITNITGTLNAENQAVAKPGTPLAAAALGAPWTQAPWNKQNGLVLFFLSPRNVIQSLAADLPGTSWRLGNLSKSNKNLEAAPDSQLSVWWAQCSTNCSFNINLWYEDKDQYLRQGNGKDNWANRPKPILSNIVPGAALGNCAMSPNYGRNGTDSWSSRLYYDQSGAISELLHDERETGEDDWAYGQTLATRVGNPSPNMAAVGYSIAGYPEKGNLGILLGMNMANGTMRVNYWNNETWHTSEEPTMLGRQFANFTSIGMFQAEDIMFYGLTNESEIHSFKVDRRDPLSWSYGEMVKTANKEQPK